MLPIDHVTVAGGALDPLRSALAAIGIETVYGGAHQDGATEMALVSFPDGSYLEAIAVHPNAASDAVENHPWSRFLTGNAGPCAWAASASDLDSEVRRLRAAGIAVSGPFANGRVRPDGARLAWQIAALGAGAPGSFFPFLIQDVTARELRAFPQGAPGNRDFRGIARVVLAVRNLDAALARYRQAYGLTAAVKQPDPAFGATLAVPGAAPVVFAQPLTSDSWLAARLDQFGESPCAILLEAVDPQRDSAVGQSRWSNLRIGWFDSHLLGWRLGWCC
jgi:hypothetical protein